MTQWDLPVKVDLDGEIFNIEKKCDFRVVLDILENYEDESFDLETRHNAALIMFYENPKAIKNKAKALDKMFNIIEYLQPDTIEKPKNGNEDKRLDHIVVWSHDFKYIAPAVSEVLGFEIRSCEYLHWWSFMGAYMNLKDCLYSQIISIRRKKRLGKKLEDWERDFYANNKYDIDIGVLSKDDLKWIYFDD